MFGFVELATEGKQLNPIDGKGGVRFARHPCTDWTHGACSLLPHPRGVPPNIRVLLAAHLDCALQAYPLQRGGR